MKCALAVMRGGWARATRVVGVVVVLSVAWLQLALPPLPHDPQAALGGGARETPELDPAIIIHHSPASKFLQNKDRSSSSSEGSKLTAEQIQEIREQIQLRSGNETVLNEELFGPVHPDTIVIAVQVHNRLEYLRHLIVSLAQARDIDTVLLIFSHDNFDEDINQLVTTIDFCKVMQIFYPHSLQTHPDSFPGESPGDCPRNTKPEEIFDDVWILRNHTGLVLFLEEDHYVAEDFLHMLRLLSAAIPRACPKCSLITLGNYLKNYNFQIDGRKVEVTQWVSSKHNMGFAFNHSVWQQIKACSSQFCNHDDYNWDWSLLHVSSTCLPQKLHTLVLRAPRVFHIGECGVHHKKKDCSSRTVLHKVHRAIQAGQHTLFPRQLVVVHTPPKKVKKHKGNGGWGDKRDHALCRSFSVSTAPDSVMVNSSVLLTQVVGNNPVNGSVIVRSGS
ncbi:alpha-1,6-mannosyl-glycoprotein 2-beta-N-acetylglucosaminyltransferase-like isoform X3 [Penaeus japonicus]|uniref:alpha-1,6-mannosyl-glycoprotein 2-beta-N-acetylglucosaminyltransferase-like isoform X3 n=1 Tax=Penaeus japonicus TaxID=27405 RepID=UPI001C715F99|nr:alpha-1,6-mannosyl-glycoprotein 2-beta-N-acetylglucosaminyltransferase-like isoform X3 [Penaeus japonicus]